MPEQIEENLEDEEANKETSLPDFLSPLAFLMFFTAGFIDLLGFVILFTGLDDLGILDFLGLIFVGGLMLAHSGTVTTAEKKKPFKKGKKISSKILKRLGLSFLIEIIPYLGSIVPTWTIAVYLHLKNS